MSLYGAYMAERSGYRIVETQHAFATYSLHKEFAVVRDVYVSPEERQKGVASKLVNEIAHIAREAGCHTLWTTVDPLAKGADISTKAIKAYGFETHGHFSDGLIWFRKELNRG